MNVPHAARRLERNQILIEMGTQRAMKSAVKKRI